MLFVSQKTKMGKMAVIGRLCSMVRRLHQTGPQFNRTFMTGTLSNNPLHQSEASKILGVEPNISSIFGEEHQKLRESLRKLIDTEINPYVDEWEEAGQFPAHTVFKKLGEAGFLGVNKPVVEVSPRHSTPSLSSDSEQELVVEQEEPVETSHGHSPEASQSSGKLKSTILMGRKLATKSSKKTSTPYLRWTTQQRLLTSSAHFNPSQNVPRLYRDK